MISVVIATYNRVNLLTRLLDELINQTIDKEEYEIIVIDDGSTDETSKVMMEYINKYNNIKYIKQNNKGPARARNKGIQMAKGDIVAFTDDDCIPDDNWLEIVKLKFAENNALIGLEGRTYTIKDKITPLTHQVTNINGGHSYPACNIAYLAEFLKKEGGFCEEFPHPHNEDVELAWRMLKYGQILFCKEMVVCHPPRHEKFISKIKWLRFLESDFCLYYKHPEKYCQTRASGPWNNLYIQFLLFTRFRSILRWIKYWRTPWFFFQSLAIVTFQSVYMLYLIPHFYRLDVEIRNGKYI